MQVVIIFCTFKHTKKYILISNSLIYKITHKTIPQKMTLDHLKSIKNAGTHKSALKFITDLQSKGIPLSAIDRNDWSSSPNTIVYVTIPYGSKKNGGKSKNWRNRFGESTLKSAIKFWKTKG